MLKRTMLMAMAGLAIAACSGEKSEALKAPPAAPAPVDIDTANLSSLIPNLAKKVNGFVLGNQAAPQTVIVFFDTQCPHCKHLWEAAQPLATSTEVKFLWVPVGLLNRASYMQGAKILTSANPLEKMKEHEATMNPEMQQYGIAAADISDAEKALIEANTKTLKDLVNKASEKHMLDSSNIGVPFIVAQDVKTRELWFQAGSMPTASLAAKLGVAVPATK